MDSRSPHSQPDTQSPASHRLHYGNGVFYQEMRVLINVLLINISYSQNYHKQPERR